ncbi:MAG: radical SAM protein [Gammaproteobacteria bacterium]|nr:radical SAM protein [Gammaproteobacteria bacterium]
MSQKRRFHIILVKPTRYDDDGYPVHWLHSSLPSNSLACMYGIALDCRDRQVLGPDVEIVVEAIDENNRRLDSATLLRQLEANGEGCLLALVGVQSNQFPRAIDIARPFTDRGLPVCMGGYHVSGVVSMFPEPTPELREAMDSGISLFAGEAENGRFDIVVRDAFDGTLKPMYDYGDDLPGLDGQPLPYVSPELVKRNLVSVSSIDLGRGCPFNCSFCCIINVQGRKSRYRSADDLEAVVRRNHRDDVKNMFITDDNFARNKNWEPLLDRLIALRAEGLQMSYIIQVDTLCHRIPNFIEKCVAAGVDQVFIGLENINPDNLASMNKKQNRIHEYREMLLAWKRHPVIIWGAYILGFPNDTRESILRDVEVIKRELPIDLLNISILTPLPGSEDHKTLVEQGAWIDPDLNKYDLAHRVTHHPTMSDEELDRVYEEAWDNYYTFEHKTTVLRRMFALGSDKRLKTTERLTAFGVFTRQHGMRSYDMGLVRLPGRRDRRPGMPLENPLVYYPRYLLHNAKAVVVILYEYWRLRRQMLRIERDPLRGSYSDAAIVPPSESEMDDLDLFQGTRGGKEVVLKVRQRRQRQSAATGS